MPPNVEGRGSEASFREINEKARPAPVDEAGRRSAAPRARPQAGARHRSRTTQRATVRRRMTAATALTFAAGSGGARVSGLLLRPDGARLLYVLAHGAGAGMRHPFLETVAQLLGERGVGTLRYQFPYMERRASGPQPPAGPVAGGLGGRGGGGPGAPGVARGAWR